jgi:hypothetical protein
MTSPKDSPPNPSPKSPQWNTTTTRPEYINNQYQGWYLPKQQYIDNGMAGHRLTEQRGSAPCIQFNELHFSLEPMPEGNWTWWCRQCEQVMGWVPRLGEGRRIYMSRVLYERRDERVERLEGERKERVEGERVERERLARVRKGNKREA